MTESEKAKILDAVIANHGAIISHMAKAQYQCTCDPDVGWVCEECSLQSLMRHLHSVWAMYPTAPATVQEPAPA
jgi:hypothetical protein